MSDSLFSESNLIHSVSTEAVAAFYNQAVVNSQTETLTWDQLNSEQRDFYKALMTHAVVAELPVFFEIKSDAWDQLKQRHDRIEDIDVPLPALEATPEGDRQIAETVLRWKTTPKGVLMPRQSELPVLLSDEQWGPTRSLAQAESLLDWLKEHGWSVNLYDYRCAKRAKTNGWWFELDRFDEPEINPSSDTDDDSIPTHYYTLDDGAPTLPLAICRAALGAAQWMLDHPQDFPDFAESHPYMIR